MVKCYPGAIQANREAWNASASHHETSARYQWLPQGFADAGFCSVDNVRPNGCKPSKS